jgi:hypothetical protein
LLILNLFNLELFQSSGECCAWPRPEITLPGARYLKDLEIVPVIFVSSEGVLVDGVRVGEVEELLRSRGSIEKLEEVLIDKRETFKALHALAKDGEVFTGRVNLASDRGIPFALIRRLMDACHAAGYPHVDFVVLKRDEWARDAQGQWRVKTLTPPAKP